MSGRLIVRDAGIGSTIQDAGRPGWAHVGVPRAGAVDPGLARFVNRLVGNPAGAAVIETCGRLVIEVDGAVLVASSCEPAPVSLRSGDTLRVDGGFGRTWHYLAVAGGVGVEPVLGSRSTDTLSGLGPAPLRAGDEIVVGELATGAITTDSAPLGEPRRVARIAPGPRLDWFHAGSFERLLALPWTVTASSRIGVRLEGQILDRAVTGELASEGLVRGAIQVPPSGELVVMSADHPTTGGYPVIAVIEPDDVANVAQAAPGQVLRLAPTAA